MPDTLPVLINKQDNFEVVRDQIAVIINENQAAQVALASAEPDPLLWKLRVFTERSNPWEVFLNEPGQGAGADESPVVSVWYESGTFDASSSDVVKRQTHEGVFNVDVYGWGQSEPDGGGGHIPGDLAAVQNATRGARLVRNILMSAQNVYLQLRNKGGAVEGPGVWQRWVQSITSFQPDIGNQAAHQIVGVRLALRVRFNEYSPQVDESNALEQIHVDIKRDSDGMLIAAALYNV